MSDKPLSVDQALRQARSLAKRGETGQAGKLCMAILAKFPANKPARALLDSLQPASALPAQAQLNELIALYNQRRLPEVLQRGTVMARQLPNHPLIPNILGAAYAAMERFGEAIASFSRALENDPGLFMAHNNMGAAYAALGRHSEAIASYSEALKLKPDYAEAHNNLGNALRTLKRHSEAAASYAKALQFKPDFAEAHGSVASALCQTGRADEAIGHFVETLRLRPGNAEMHNSLGVALSGLGRHDEAIASYRAALQAKPDLPEALNNLCELLEKTHQIDDLRRIVAQAQANFPADDAQLSYWLAELAIRDGCHEQARDHLAAAAAPDLPLKVQLKRSGLLGKTYDRLGQFDLAFLQFAETNRFAAQWQSFRDYDATRYVDEVQHLERAWAQAPQTDWRIGPENQPENPISLAFLVGFPRSGTTLLDTVLRSHPGITVIEEMPLIERVKIALGGPPTFATLEALEDGEVLGLRAIYLDQLGAHLGGDPAPGLVIDKLPLNLINAGLIHRILPEAKFILAQRHPCDCVLSCFMQNFQLNDAMASFLDLGQTARLYDLAMTLWRHYQQKLGLEVGYLKYEDLVQDLRLATEPLLGFLGLQWDDALTGYQQTALARGRINTPSYNQVIQGLYTRASGRWQNYRTQMAPVLPLLQPWAAEWGYPS